MERYRIELNEAATEGKRSAEYGSAKEWFGRAETGKGKEKILKAQHSSGSERHRLEK